MTDIQPTPEEELAGAIGELSQQTRNLVRREINVARLEMVEGIKQDAPVLAQFETAALFGVLALGSAYRLSLRILERRLSPGGAALAATVGYGGLSLGLALAAWSRRDQLQQLIPSRTVRATVEGAKQAATEGPA